MGREDINTNTELLCLFNKERVQLHTVCTTFIFGEILSNKFVTKNALAEIGLTHLGKGKRLLNVKNNKKLYSLV